MSGSVFLGSREVGPGRPCYVIAEAGVNHNGDLDLARGLIAAAAAAGADAVKFQTFAADRLAAATAATAEYQAAHTGESSQLDMLRRLELSPAAHRDLRAHAERHGISFLSTPFDAPCADLLDGLGVCAFKVSSGDLTDLPFLAHLARTGRPVILSTGMADEDEVAAAVEALRRAGNRDLVLLHCVSLYPAEAAQCNLRVMAALGAAFDAPVGFSDHTLGQNVALAAVALGACVLEKHLTLDRALPGPDHAASMEPTAFAELVRGVRAVESALGDGVKRPVAEESGHRVLGRKSLHWGRALAPGARVRGGDLIALRPATGLPPGRAGEFLGRRLTRAVGAGEVVREQDVTGAPLAEPDVEGADHAVLG